MILIRKMREEDVEAIRAIEAVAFGALDGQLTGKVAVLPLRTRTNVLALRDKHPQGCFVAQEGDRVLGFVFSRTWGSVGWFGPLGVLPACQGHGIGKRLVTASVDSLRQDPNRLVGLEARPESAYNLGLYLRLGFEAQLPTLSLSKDLQPSGIGPAGLSRWSAASAATRQRWSAELREATGQIFPGLDYSQEITGTARHSLGETLVLTDGANAIGLSTLWLVGSRERGDADLASLQVLALHPAHTNAQAFRLLIDGSEALGAEYGKSRLMVSVNAGHAWALEKLLHWGYRIERAMVRLVLRGTGRGPSVDNYVELSRWMG